MLEPRRLLTFRAVAAHGSFSRAAAALALSQPAVSHQVAALERELGTRAARPRPAGTVPTPAGALLLVHAEALAARLALAGDQMAALAAGERRTLRIGAFPTALATIVPDAIARRAGRSPRWRWRSRRARGDARAPRSRAGRLDAAVAFQDAAAPPREHDGLRRTELGEEPMLALLPGRARARGPRPDRPARARRRSVDGAARRRACSSPPAAPPASSRGSSCARATRSRRAALAAAGLAVSLTPRLAARLPLPGVVTPALRGGGPRRALYALSPPRARTRSPARWTAALADALAA